MKRNNWLFSIVLSLLLGGGTVVCNPAQAQSTPALQWAGAYDGGDSDRAICVAGSLTHVYVAGRVASDAGTAFALLQYQYPAGSGQTAQLRSSATFPVYFGSGYEPTCMTSFNGGPQPPADFEYTQVIVAGTVPHSDGLRPVIASFETKPYGSPGSGIGDLRLMWSVIADPTTADEIPVDITIDGERVAIVSQIKSAATHDGLIVRVYRYDSGKVMMDPQTYTGADTTPVGVSLSGNFAIITGSGVNPETSDAEAFALAYAILDDPGYFSSGTQFGPFFASSGSGRTFRATCMAAAENHQVNWNGGAQFADIGRSHATSSPSNGDWFVQTWTLTGDPFSHEPSFTPGWSSTGKSSSSFDDVPVAACLGLTPVNYDGGGEAPIPAYFRLWVTGDRVPLSSGDSQVTTVQFNLSGGAPGAIEWYNHFARSGMDCRAASIGAMDFTSGLHTRAYVGAYVESATSGHVTDFAMLKYSSEPTNPAGNNRDNIWDDHAIYALTGAQQSTSIMPLNVQWPTSSPIGRTIMITGWTGSLPDMLSLRYADTND